MESRDTCLLTLVLVSMHMIVSMDARSWDIAVGIGQDLHFFSKNRTRVGDAKVATANNIGSIAYDSDRRTMYLTDKKLNVSIYGKQLSILQEPYPILNRETNSSIAQIEFHSSTRTLFWTDGQLHRIMAMHIPANNSIPEEPRILHDLGPEKPHGIAIDGCNGYIYWTVGFDSQPTIQRSRLDGSDRKIIINDSLSDPVGLVVDHATAKLYWSDYDLGSFSCKIERSNLDGSRRETVLRGKKHSPWFLAVDKKFLYFVDVSLNKIYAMEKNVTDKLPEIFSDSFADYAKSDLSNIVTRDNIENVDCNAMFKLDENEFNKRITPTAVSSASINFLTSTEAFDTGSTKKKNCLNNGTYDELRETCSCKKGFSGLFCEISLCHNFCVHGKCIIGKDGSPECKCDTSYSGKRCEHNVCDGYCLNNGKCTIIAGEPTCECPISGGSRCEYSVDVDKLCSLYCSGTGDMFKDHGIEFCECSRDNETTTDISNHTEPFVPSAVTLSVLGTVIGLFSIVIIVLSYHVNKLMRRPRIRKRFVVNKSGVTPLTSRPQLPTDSCEITIENCCNMNICETPCFEPKLRTTPSKGTKTKREEKNSLLDAMEGAESC